MTVLEKIVQALHTLGGSATYSEIYREIELIDQKLLTVGQKPEYANALKIILPTLKILKAMKTYSIL